MDPQLPPTPYRDRKLGLILFGLFAILIGVLFGFATTQIFLHKGSASALKPGALAVIFVWLGVGSILQTRWARALLLILSWCWLILGTICTSLFGFLFPDQIRVMTSHSPEMRANLPFQIGVIFCFIFIFGLILIAIPAVLMLFYKSRNVKATCEARNPGQSWTDACPLPVLGTSLWIALSGASMGLGALSSHSIFAAFGMFVVGPASSLLYLFVVAIFAYCSWSLYKLDQRALWIFAATLILLTVSSAITYSRHDVSDIYALMGYTPSRIAAMKQLTYLRGSGLRITTLLTAIPTLGYLFYLRRYFPPPKIPS